MNEGKAFIDTNVFVYAKLKPAQDEAKRRAAVGFLQDFDLDAVVIRAGKPMRQAVHRRPSAQSDY